MSEKRSSRRAPPTFATVTRARHPVTAPPSVSHRRKIPRRGVPPRKEARQLQPPERHGSPVRRSDNPCGANVSTKRGCSAEFSEDLAQVIDRFVEAAIDVDKNARWPQPADK